MPEKDLAPWEIHSSLKATRLKTIGRIVWAARESAADDANQQLGDSIWSIGCTAYERTCYALETASQHVHWLSLTSRNANDGFIFAIGGVPIRFYRGDPDTVAPQKYACARPVELSRLQLAFALTDTPTPDSYFRLVVKTDRQGFPLSVTLVQVNTAGEIRNPWKIPVDSGTSVQDLTSSLEQPVRLPPPPVGGDVSARESTRREIEDRA